MKREESAKAGSRRLSRRDFVRRSGKAAAAPPWPGWRFRTSTPAEDNTIRLALIGCGGRGSGAVANALSVPGGTGQAGGHGRPLRGPAERLAQGPRPSSSARRSTCRRTGSSWASTPTARRSTACGPATWPC